MDINCLPFVFVSTYKQYTIKNAVYFISIYPTIYTWIKNKQTKEEKQNRPELATEHVEMQKEIQRLKEENEI
ncbi:hypothetical protein, partial [Listeria seeligeri]|uniref:hypothetical protein n=1 Tax=Listeria seeligeri TaxID=1640 RepID=UPI0022EBF764